MRVLLDNDYEETGNPPPHSFAPPPRKNSPLFVRIHLFPSSCETVLLVSGEKVLRVFCVLYIGFVGKMWYAKSGNCYEGEWKDGKENGKGKKFNKNGKLIEEGRWENGTFKS